MNVSAMRRVDRWVAAPLCALLTLVRRLDDLVLRRAPGDRPHRIAVIKLAEQGATVLAYPALLRARELVGRDNLFFVVFAQNRFIVDLLEVLPRDNVIAIRGNSIVQVVVDTLRAVWRMHRERIDAAIDFEFFARSSAVLTYLSGARLRVGYHAFAGEASYRGDLMTHRMSFNPLLHASEMFDVLVRAVTLPADKLPACDVVPQVEGPHPEHRPHSDRIAEVEALLRQVLGVDDVPPVLLLNANCSDLLPIRRWPPERYVELARRLLERFPEIAIAFTGAPDEAEGVRPVVEQIGSPRCVSLAGRTTLEQLFALYTVAELMVTNDSGPAQYAALTPLDVITLFGPETPAVFGSRTPRSHILWSGIACSPCVNAFNDRQSACRDNLCLQRITVDQVFDLACELYLARRGRGRSESGPRPGQASAAGDR